MGKLTISMVMFNNYVTLLEGMSIGESRNQDRSLQRLVGAPCPLACRGNMVGGSTGFLHEHKMNML